nr:TPA_asm: m18 iORF RNA 1 [Murid betaherpesvirus 1]DBA07931.1 TPA_asm: m18 iORF RNA 1 [Murid betaherpesvirus 1]
MARRTTVGRHPTPVPIFLARRAATTKYRSMRGLRRNIRLGARARGTSAPNRPLR